MTSARSRSALRSMGVENIRFAFRSILVQRLRSFLTLLGIVSGVAPAFHCSKLELSAVSLR